MKSRILVVGALLALPFLAHAATAATTQPALYQISVTQGDTVLASAEEYVYEGQRSKVSLNWKQDYVKVYSTVLDPKAANPIEIRRDKDTVESTVAIELTGKPYGQARTSINATVFTLRPTVAGDARIELPTQHKGYVNDQGVGATQEGYVYTLSAQPEEVPVRITVRRQANDRAVAQVP